MDKYKENQLRLALYADKERMKIINMLKELQCNNENKNYTVIYRQERQQKNRRFKFHKVQYVSQANSFIFTEYESTNNFLVDSVLTDKVTDKITLLDIEIIDCDIEEIDIDGTVIY